MEAGGLDNSPPLNPKPEPKEGLDQDRCTFKGNSIDLHLIRTLKPE